MKIVRSHDGIIAEMGRRTIGLDYLGRRHLAQYFVSHAHSDHISRSLTNKDVICSSPTSIFASMRGIQMNQVGSSELKLIPNGHMLGSSGLLVGDQLLYSGDFNDRDRPFSLRFKPPKAKVLLMEATYGRPFFRFPKEHDVVAEARDKIYDLLNRGKNVIVLGYALGKSQHLQLFLDKWFTGYKTYIWPMISRYNDIYRLFGARISEKTEASSASIPTMMEKGGWLLYMPSYASRIAVYDELRKKGAYSISFTGWAAYHGYAESVNVDLALPLSDHADFEGLVRTVEEVNPELVLVTHGFTKDFTSTLRKIGVSTGSGTLRMHKLSRYLA